MLEVVEHGELHIGVDTVDERDSAIGEGEHHGVLVRDSGWPEQPACRLVKLEPFAVPAQLVGADAPRSVAGLRQAGVGHHQPLAAAVLHPLHSRVLKAQRAPDACAGKDVAVVVAVPVGRGEHHDVGDVVDETRAGAVTEAVAIAHGPREEVR